MVDKVNLKERVDPLYELLAKAIGRACLDCGVDKVTALAVIVRVIDLLEEEAA